MFRRLSLGIFFVVASASACTTEATAPKLEDTWINTTQTSKAVGVEMTNRSITFANGRFDQRFQQTQESGATTVALKDCFEGSYTYDDHLLTLKVERHYAFDVTARSAQWRTETRTITGTVDFPNGDTLEFTPSDGSEKLVLKRGARPADLVCN